MGDVLQPLLVLARDARVEGGHLGGAVAAGDGLLQVLLVLGRGGRVQQGLQGLAVLLAVLRQLAIGLVLLALADLGARLRGRTHDALDHILRCALHQGQLAQGFCITARAIGLPEGRPGGLLLGRKLLEIVGQLRRAAGLLVQGGDLGIAVFAGLAVGGRLVGGLDVRAQGGQGVDGLFQVTVRHGLVQHAHASIEGVGLRRAQCDGLGQCGLGILQIPGLAVPVGLELVPCRLGVDQGLGSGGQRGQPACGFGMVQGGGQQQVVDGLFPGDQILAQGPQGLARGGQGLGGGHGAPGLEQIADGGIESRLCTDLGLFLAEIGF